MDEVAGRVLKAGVVKDSPLPRRLLAVPREVERGDRVQVEASFGAATVGSTAEAESAGAVGDTVLVRNLETGKRFRARVEGKGRVALRAARGGQTWDTPRN
jgi:flagella basal body P-ring formation protein FlgA